MKRKIAAAFGFFMAATSFAADCPLVPAIVTPLITVSPYSSFKEKFEKIGDELQKIYGDTYKDSEIYQVRIPVKVCLLGICGTSIETSMYKTCGKTMKQSMQDVALNAPGGGLAGGGGGGSTGSGSSQGGGGQAPPSNPFMYCSNITIQSCMTGGGNSGQTCRVDTSLQCPIVVG